MRRGKVPLSKVEFNLLPPSLDESQTKMADDVEKLYKTCYALVYPEQVPDSLFRLKDANQRLQDISDELGLSVRVFILTCMTARKSLAPEAKFYANFLIAKNSDRIVRDYISLAKEKFGAFDHESLAQVTGVSDKLSIDSKRIRDSEVLTGRWLVGYKIRKSGSPLAVFYAENELRLSAVWLSLEPSYIDIHNQLDGISQEQNYHRMEVRRVRRWLGKRKHVAVAYFERRSELFKDSVEEVLGHYGYELDDFESAPIVHDAMKFWGRLALAIQHMNCLKMADLL